MPIILADNNGQVDSAYHTLVRHIQSSIPIVMISWVENFVFNPELLKIKDYILICFCEYGYDAVLTDTHLWGNNSEKFTRYYTGDWVKFDDWVKENPPKLILKRELLKKDVSEKVQPIDYAATTQSIPIQSEEEFYHRPLSACYYFGRSHEGRLEIHSDIWKGATVYGYSVCDNIYYFNGFIQHESGKKYFSAHIPHYQRHPIEEVLIINGLAKIGIAPFGAGQKTFRSQEVSSNSVMLMWEDNLAWGIEWVHGFNCLKCKIGEEVEIIEKWIKDPALYSIYLEGVKTWDRYRVGRYISEYINPIINKNCK